MLKKIIWSKKVLLKELENIKLPFSFSFITEFNENELYAIGLTSTFKDISWNELKMVNEGFYLYLDFCPIIYQHLILTGF